MAKLIGTAPNQVPTNADLGSLAYMDKDNFNANISELNLSELTLKALAETISDTAVDIFVYDTRKDSDGGAWRKRTQHTSWYNETLNTATRGSRKEFPAVAVIVLRTNAVTIYDGDDPDLPMWWYGMSSNIGGFGMNGAQAVSMLNGLMVIGQNDTSGSNYDGLRVLDFVRDYGYWTWYNNNGSMYEGTLLSSSGGVTNRSRYYPFLITSGNLVAKEVNDVAMTVLPNAPIDAATGLPVPTIAVGTGLGTSIIRDDGTVVDYTLGNYTIASVDFDYDNNIIQSSRNIGSGGGGLYVNKYPILSADNNSGNVQQELVLSSTAGDNTSSLDFIRTPFVEGTKNVVGMKDSTLAFSSNAGAVQGIGVYQLGPDGTTKTTTLGAVISSDYNTGWMNGDIKLATLSDTDDTDVTYTNLVSNGDFASGITGWTASGDQSWSYNSSNQTAQFTGTSQSWFKHSATIEDGAQYVMSFEIKAAGSGTGIRPYIGGGTYSQSQFYTAVGVHSVSFVADSSSNEAVLNIQSTGGTWEVDNVTISRAEEDRSVNGNGLQVFGTVTKNPVATGADLVSYRSNGTLLAVMSDELTSIADGDFAINLWAKFAFDGLYEYVCQFNNNDGAFGIHFSAITSTKRLQLSGMGVQSNTNVLVEDKWQMITAVRRNGVVTFYVDGKDAGGGSSTTSLSYSHLRLLRLQFNTNTYGDSSTNEYALFRLSATAPSPE